MNGRNGHHHEQVADGILCLPLPPGWAQTTIAELGEVRLGRQRSPKNRSGKYPTKYLRAANITWQGLDLSDVLDMDFRPHEQVTYRLESGDVLLSEASGSAGEVGKPAVWNGEIENCCFQNTVVRFRPKAVVPKFAHMAFLHFARNGVFSRVAKGVGIHHLSADRFSVLPFLLPPAAEQHRIVAKVDELFSDLDAGVAVLERVKANLRRYRASVLKAAVEGRLTAEWRAEHHSKETGADLLVRILKERRRKWENNQLAAFAKAGKEPPKNWQSRYKQPVAPDTTTLPKLPKGWCWASVEQVGSVQLGRQRSPQHHNGPHMRPYLRVANVFEDRIDISDVMEMNFTPDEFETYKLSFGDILLNEGQSMELVGRPAMYRDEFPGACFTNTLIRFRSLDGVDAQFALKVFLAYLKNGRFQKIATITVNIAHLGAGRFSEIEFPLPPMEEQAAIIEEVDRHFSLIVAAEQVINVSLARAAQLRQSILKRAFEGKLVAQEPADEPASVLLDHIRNAGQAAPSTEIDRAKPAGRRKAKEPREVFFRRASIVSYTIKRLASHRSFGRTQLEKTLHITQTHLGVDLGLQFERYAAGPFDKTIYRLEGAARKNGWFTTQDRKKFGVTYHPGPKTEAMCQCAARYVGPKQADLDRLLDHISQMNTDEAELFATAYAAWNDLLIDGRPAHDEAIIEEVYGWDASKAKFSRSDILRRLAWMRKHGYVPQGTGQRTAVASKRTELRRSRGRRNKTR